MRLIFFLLFNISLRHLSLCHCFNSICMSFSSTAAIITNYTWKIARILRTDSTKKKPPQMESSEKQEKKIDWFFASYPYSAMAWFNDQMETYSIDLYSWFFGDYTNNTELAKNTTKMELIVIFSFLLWIFLESSVEYCSCNWFRIDFKCGNIVQQTCVVFN